MQRYRSLGDVSTFSKFLVFKLQQIIDKRSREYVNTLCAFQTRSLEKKSIVERTQKLQNAKDILRCDII